VGEEGRMAKDRKIHVGVQNVQLPPFISRSKKLKPKKSKLYLVLISHGITEREL
jgi:hypothetical protein